MARDFNQNRVTNAKLGRETLNKFGANFALNYGLDGFNIVDIQAEEIPNDIKAYLEGDDTYEIFAIPSNVEKLCEYALASFTNITDLYLFCESVVDIEDDLSYLTNLSVIYVPTDLLSAYQTQYASVPNILNKLQTIVVDYELTIPVYENFGNVLNDDIINYFISGLSQQQKDALTKLIISSDYVDYYSEVWHFNFSEVFENLDNNIYYGNTQIDFTSYIIQGSGELTSGIVQDNYNDISIDKEISDITKVTVPVSFTSYVSGSISKIEQLFSDMEYIESCYDEGNIDIEINGDVHTRILSLNRTLDEALVSAKNYTGTGFNGSLLIFPPMSLDLPCRNVITSSAKTVYIPKLTFNGSAGEKRCDINFPNIANLLRIDELNINYQMSMWYQANIVSSSWKYIKINFVYGADAIDGGFVADATSQQDIILNNCTIGPIYMRSETTREKLVQLFNSLGTPNAQLRIIVGANNLAKLTAEDIAIATAKNWVVQ